MIEIVAGNFDWPSTRTLFADEEAGEYANTSKLVKEFLDGILGKRSSNVPYIDDTVEFLRFADASRPPERGAERGRIWTLRADSYLVRTSNAEVCDDWFIVSKKARGWRSQRRLGLLAEGSIWELSRTWKDLGAPPAK